MEEVVIRIVNKTIAVGIGGKALGNTNSKFGAEADVNFAKFAVKFPGKTVYDMPAVGKDTIVDVDPLTPAELWELEADALITEKPTSLLVLKSADCIPLVFYVPGHNLLALAHVGTTGAAMHLPGKVIGSMKLPADQLHCYIGPSISQKAYRFNKEDEQHFKDKKLDSSWDNYISREDDGIHLNLLGYVMDELKHSGIKEENIEQEPIDTGSNNNYFSHRRHKLTGEVDGRNTFGVHLV